MAANTKISKKKTTCTSTYREGPHRLEDIKLRIGSTSVIPNGRFKKPDIIYHVLVADSRSQLRWITNCTLSDFVRFRNSLKDIQKHIKHASDIESVKLFSMFMKKLTFPKSLIFRSSSNQLVVKGRCVDLEYFLTNCVKEALVLLKNKGLPVEIAEYVTSQFSLFLQPYSIEVKKELGREYKSLTPPSHLLDEIHFTS